MSEQNDQPQTPQGVNDETVVSSAIGGENAVQEPVSPLPVTPEPHDADDIEQENAFAHANHLQPTQHRKKQIITGVICAAAVVIVVVTVLLTQQPAPSTNNQAPATPANVNTQEATRDTFSVEASSTGTIQPVNSIDVTPDIDGTIDKVSVTEGQHVNKGDELFTIKNDDLDTAVNDADRAVKTAQTNLDQANANKEKADRDRAKVDDDYNQKVDAANDKQDHVKQLEEISNQGKQDLQQANDNLAAAKEEAKQKKIPEDQSQDVKDRLNDIQVIQSKLTDADNNLKPAQAEMDKANQAAGDAFNQLSSKEQAADDVVNAAQQAVDKAQSDLDTANDNLAKAKDNAKKRSVTAPSEGTIVNLNASTGSPVTQAGKSSNAADTTPKSVCQIADLSKMKVTAQVNEADINKIKEGETAHLTFPALDNLKLDAQVDTIASAATDNGPDKPATYAVDLLVPAPDGRLKPGMTVQVSIVTQDLPNALVVPAAALTDNNDGTSTLKVETDAKTHETRDVTVVVDGRNATEAAVSVKNGNLDKGDMVVVPQDSNTNNK